MATLAGCHRFKRCQAKRLVERSQDEDRVQLGEEPVARHKFALATQREHGDLAAKLFPVGDFNWPAQHSYQKAGLAVNHL